ncbi:MAG TPA: hypothetical protein VM915_09695 [Verrucomicrobiae bacterium]|jgi:hypothetical protein|nr:hypothetical protein [Verrucomicrobiae bacterium]
MATDPIALSKKAHDAERQSRAVLVRLSEDEAAAADKLRRPKETRAALLRRLLNERAQRKAR